MSLSDVQDTRTGTDASPPWPAWSKDAPLFVVLNGGSGRCRADVREQRIGTLLSAAGRRYECLTTAHPRDLPALARDACRRAAEAGGAVVVAGGDGSINTVVQQALGTHVPLGVLPQGTFNYSARNHGVPDTIEGAVRALLNAQVRPVQVARVNQRVFMVNASLGLYPQVLEEREGFKRRFGRSRPVAVMAGLISLLRDQHRRLRLEVVCDGRRQCLQTRTLVVGNNRLQLEQVGVGEAVAVEQGRLVGIAVRPIGTVALIGLAVRGLAGRLGDDAHVQTVVFHELCVHSRGRRRHRGRLKVAIDGEVCRLALPLRFHIDPVPLPLLVPATAEASA